AEIGAPGSVPPAWPISVLPLPAALPGPTAFSDYLLATEEARAAGIAADGWATSRAALSDYLLAAEEVCAAGIDDFRAAFDECTTGGASREDPQDAAAHHFDAGARFTGRNIERLTAAHCQHGNRPLPCIPSLACARLPRSARHHLAHIDAVDRLIDVLAGALETTAPILGVAQHPQPARLLVVLPYRIEDFPVCLNETGHTLLHLSQNDLGGR